MTFYKRAAKYYIRSIPNNKGETENVDYAKESLKLHYEWRGKLEITPRAAVSDKTSLSLAYTPGVAQPCLKSRRTQTRATS
jgi:malic enzyme